MSVELVESRIRDIAKERKCRMRENFIDFDRLRSGFVTVGQFFRVLKGLLGFSLKSEEADEILRKYGNSDKNRVNWIRFVQDIEGYYDPNDFNTPPEFKMLMTIDSPHVGIKAFHPKAGDENFDSLRAILSRICQYNSWYGYDPRDCFKQFDIHNVGEVSESQFYRSLPGPKDLTEQELAILVERYKSLKNTGFVDYIALASDLEKLKFAEKDATLGSPVKKQSKEISNNVDTKEDLFRPSLNMIIDRIRFAVRRRGIRVLDFFIDYDKLRHDEVTQSQFICALLLAVGKEAQLTREDVQMLCNAYAKSTNPKLVAYRNLCRMVDEVHDVPNLEKDPLRVPELVPMGSLARGMPQLVPEEEQRVSKILEEIRSKVRKNRILLFPYFQDYDLGTGNSRVISCSQFARTLQFLGLGVSDEDCHRLCRKFTDPTTGMVNYALFCQAADETFTARQMDTTAHPDPNLEALQNGQLIHNTVRGKRIADNWEALVTPTIRTAGDKWPVDVLLDRIRHIVLTNRIQLKPWFQDFDPLRSGYVTSSQFSRALTAAGITRLDLHELTPSQMNVLVEAYRSPREKNLVNWYRFAEDVDSVFTLPNLEKSPMVRVMPQETFVQPKPGSADWTTANEEMRQNYEESMAILRRTIHERRMLLLPDFLAFDKAHRGYVWPHNFRQLVTMFNFSVTPAGIDAIIARHANDDGFDYRSFLAELDPPDKSDLEYKYPERLRILQQTNIIGKQRKEMEPVIRDTEGVLDQLKMDVYRRRIRLADAFRDFDTLNHGTLPKMTFRRCIGSLPITLNETALSLIEDRYRSSVEGEINWKDFCDEIERVFQTPHLEKDPLIEPEEYKPESLVKQNYLSVDVAKKADGAIVKIADKVRQRRLQLLPMFSDFDETHRLTVSQNQFRRVLMTLDLADMLTEDEWSCLYCKYRHTLGVVDNINYQAFVEDVYNVAGIDPHIP